MPLTPQIRLTINLDDYSGNQIGSAQVPAYVRIALVNFGPFLPRVSGTAMIAKVVSWPGDIPYLGVPITVTLWGNDVITPVGTQYAISILDANKNVLQTNAYQFSGTITADLSTLSPYIPVPPTPPEVVSGLVTVPFSTTPVFNCALIDGNITFDFTLTGNVVSSTLINAFPGQWVCFFIRQNATGGWTFAWPSNVKNPGVVNPDPSSVSAQAFVADASGNLYPIGPMTYS